MRSQKTTLQGHDIEHLAIPGLLVMKEQLTSKTSSVCGLTISIQIVKINIVCARVGKGSQLSLLAFRMGILSQLVGGVF